MAAIQVSKQPQQPHVRTRSTSDPFSDPVYPTGGVRMAQVPRSAPMQTPPKQSSRAAAKAPATEPPRAKMHRSQTAAVPHGADAHGHAAPMSKRSMSQDSVIRAATSLEKSKAQGRRPGKKSSAHADVIDRLDFSGVGPMFHHDGPFDACAPSRNRHSNRAPMLAWGAASAAKDDAALARAQAPQASPRRDQYTTPAIPYEAPKKAHDALAEAWGIHEPEPFEEFSAGGGRGSAFRGPAAAAGPGASTPPGRRSREHAPPPSSAGAAARHAHQHAARRDRDKRTPLPPPQPIFVDDGGAAQGPDEPDSAPSSPTSPTRPGAPKRSKSLMQRIRTMRDNPNVPAGATQDGYYVEAPDAGAPAPPGQYAERPTHRHQRSFLGRKSAGARDEAQSPGEDKDFVHVEKGLGDGAYFDEGYNGVGDGAGLGRKTSLMKKAKGLMRGGR